ncbi:MAG TPA: hypothetical protein VHU23_17815 [Rhizomicrobium sp.]|nr:hypothetical protein [Rhizomicrobium sp.]
MRIPPEKLRHYSGRYGTITLRLADDGLRLSRSDRPRWEQDALLTPLTDDGLFSVQGFDDLRIRLNDTSLDLLHGNENDRENFPRETAAH